MKVLLREYATFISQNLHKDFVFKSHVESLYQYGITVRIIYTYGPHQINPILRTVEEFKEFIRQCPDRLPSNDPRAVPLTGEIKTGKPGQKNIEGNGKKI